jgi:hypothetical protein
VGRPAIFQLHFWCKSSSTCNGNTWWRTHFRSGGENKLTSSGTGFRRTRKLLPNNMAVNRVHLGLKVDQAHQHFAVGEPVRNGIGPERRTLYYHLMKWQQASPVHMRCESIVGTTNAAHEFKPWTNPMQPTTQQQDWSTWDAINARSEPVAHQQHTMKDGW